MVSSFALVALAAAQAESGVKWVPLTPPSPKEQPAVKPQAQPSPQPSVHAPASHTVPVVSRSPGPLRLTCLGGGTADKVRGTYVSGYGGSATILSRKDRGFQDQVDLRLFEGDDRIRMPRSMLPGIRGGKDGWFKLKNLVADTRSIRASAAVNALNNPKVFIDRVTGTISISGKSGDYSGRCEVIDAAAAPKF